MEEYAIVIEYMPEGRSSEGRGEPTVQLVGYQFFTLLEATIKPGASIISGQKVYVGKNERKEIDRIKRRITYNELTVSGKEFLTVALRKIVEERAAEFVEFLNKASPISIRVHRLELLPGLGKKNLEAVLNEREKKPFESFEDVKNRIHTIGDPVAMFVNRIINELEGKEKYYLFVKPPIQPGSERYL